MLSCLPGVTHMLLLLCTAQHRQCTGIVAKLGYNSSAMRSAYGLSVGGGVSGGGGA